MSQAERAGGGEEYSLGGGKKSGWKWLRPFGSEPGNPPHTQCIPRAKRQRLSANGAVCDYQRKLNGRRPTTPNGEVIHTAIVLRIRITNTRQVIPRRTLPG